MKHGVFPLMELDVFPEDTLFFVFEEDWCLTHEHAKLREMRSSPEWWPLLKHASTTTLNMLTEIYQAAHDLVSTCNFDPQVLWPLLQKGTKQCGLDAYREAQVEPPPEPAEGAEIAPGTSEPRVAPVAGTSGARRPCI